MNQKLEHAMKVINAPAGSYDHSTVQCAREIICAHINAGITSPHAKPIIVLTPAKAGAL